MADTTTNENVQRQLEAQKKASERSRAEYNARMQGKPTPTQEENDRAALGEHIVEHEYDGSPYENDLNADEQKRMSEARPGAADYQTRHARTAQPAQPRKSE